MPSIDPPALLILVVIVLVLVGFAIFVVRSSRWTELHDAWDELHAATPPGWVERHRARSWR